VLLQDGRTVVADDNYIRESILSPAAKVVSGFQPIMPTFQGIVNEDQVNALVAYIKSLSNPPQGAENEPSLRSPGKQPQNPK
jgi:cytochrome c oxidase subunit 2